jgi:hypothetical protein
MGVTKLSFLKSKLISTDIIFDFEKKNIKKNSSLMFLNIICNDSDQSYRMYI